MNRSRRAVLMGLAAAPWAGCSGAGTERRPPHTPATVPIDLPPISRGALTTGPGLYLARDSGVPLVALGVAVAAGHRHEAPGQEGWAKVAAAMVLEGIEGEDRVALLERYGELGTTPSVSVGVSQVVLACTVHRDDAAAALRLMLENLRRPSRDPAAFERVRREHAEALRVARATPEAVAGLGLLLASQGVDPPAMVLPEGMQPSLEALTVEQAARWLPSRLRLGTLTFLVAGDVERPEALEWIGGATAGWAVSTEPDPPASPLPVVRPLEARPRTVLVRWPALPQAIVALGGPREPYGHPDEPVETLADGVMGGQMHHELRSRQRISYGVQMRSWKTTHGVAAQLWSKVDPAHAGDAIGALWAVLERLQRETWFSSQTLARELQYEMVSMMHRHRGPDALLELLRRLADDDLPGFTPRRRLDRLGEFGVEEVTAALRGMFHPDRISVCIVGDAAVLEQARAVLPADGIAERTPTQLFGLP